MPSPFPLQINLPPFSPVEFKTRDGVTLRGNFYLSPRVEKGKPAPAIILTQGYALLKEFYLENWFSQFLQAGLHVLIYDHRNIGDSEGGSPGEERLDLAPEDYIDATTFVLSLPDSDGRVFIWGIGHSGGSAGIAASRDDRLAGVILTMPHIDGRYDYDIWPTEWRQYALNWRYGTPNLDPKYLKFWPVNEKDAEGKGDSVLTSNFIWQWTQGAFERAQAAGKVFPNKVAVSSLWSTYQIRPRDHFSKIKVPLFWQVTSDDKVSGPTETAKAVFETLTCPKTMVDTTGEHLPAYFGRQFQRGVDAQCDWLLEQIAK